MNTRLLFFASLILIAFSVFFIKPSLQETNSLCVADSNKLIKPARIEGALEWRYAKLLNSTTGEFSIEDYKSAVSKADALQTANNKKGLLNMEWEAIGPDNYGGRTRAILYDRKQQGLIWVGSVSGGLFNSVDNGRTWNRVTTYDGIGPIASMVQDANGHIYVGTGEGLSHVKPAVLNIGTSFSTAILGNGMWKSKDNGLTWTHLPGTVVNSNGASGPSSFWSEVNSIAIHPNDQDLVFAAGRTGLKYSKNAGEDLVDWNFVPGLPISNNPASPSGSANIPSRGMDVEISSSGDVAFAVLGGKLYRSFISSNPSDMSDLAWSQVGIGILPSTSYRADVAISPSNPNVVYASFSSECMDGVFRSIDKGDSWLLIKSGGAPYENDPFNQPSASFGMCNGQGFYDHTLGVNPADENKIYIGGITFYVWGQGYGFKRADLIGSELAGPFDTEYIHADKHAIEFDPHDPSGNTMLIGSDGGLTECRNANSGFPDHMAFVQRNKNYQSLQIYGMGAGRMGEVFAGTQDNGSLYIDGLGASAKGAIEVTGGDGVYAEVSNFDSDVMFSGIYFGQLFRSINRGTTGEVFLDSHIDQSYCGRISCSNTVEQADCGSLEDAPFVYPIYLMETSNVDFQDTTAIVYARNDTLLLASGDTSILLDTIYPNYMITTSILLQNGERIVNRVVEENIQYQAISKVSNLVRFNVDVDQILYPNDTIYYLDPYDAKYFVTSDCNLWMCINPVRKEQNPIFYKISGSNSGIKNFDASKDGNHLYYITNNRLYIVSGLNLIHQTIDPNGCHFTNCTSAGLTINQVNLPISSIAPGLEGVAVDKNNPNTVLVTAGGFGNSGKVWRVENALSNSPNVVPLQTTDFTLPYMPIYHCIIDNDNPQRYLLGTELGIWSSNDAGLTWSEENFGIDIRLPVYSIRQEYLYNEGCMVLYAGTHGGGMYRSTSLLNGACDPKPYQWDKYKSPLNVQNVSSNIDFKVFPNPVRDFVNIQFELNKSADIKMMLIDVTRRVVEQYPLGLLSAKKQDVKLNFGNLSTGNYVLAMYVNNEMQSSHIVVKN